MVILFLRTAYLLAVRLAQSFDELENSFDVVVLAANEGQSALEWVLSEAANAMQRTGNLAKV